MEEQGAQRDVKPLHQLQRPVPAARQAFREVEDNWKFHFSGDAVPEGKKVVGPWTELIQSESALVSAEGLLEWAPFRT